MESANLPPDQLLLYNLLSRDRQKQTEELRSEFQHLVTNKLENQNRELEILKNRCIQLERKIRKNNVLIFGMKNTTDNKNLFNDTQQMLSNILGVNITVNDINNIYKIGDNEKAPVIVEFISYLKKITLFENKEKFKKLKEHGLAIVNDLCVEDREENNILRKHLKNARSQNLDARIFKHKLIINAKSFTVEYLKKLENSGETSEEEEENTAEEERGEIIQIHQARDINESKQGENLIKQPLVKSTSTKDSRQKRARIDYSPKNTRTSKKT